MNDVLHTYHAQPMRPVDRPAVSASLHIDLPPREQIDLETQRRDFHNKAETLEAFLFRHLPGGLYTALYAVMAKRNANLLFISQQDTEADHASP